MILPKQVLLFSSFAAVFAALEQVNINVKRGRREFWEYQGIYTTFGPYAAVPDLDPGMSNQRYSVPIPIESHKCIPHTLNRTDYRQAYNNMVDWCEHFEVAPHSLYTSVVDDVAVYVCSEGKQKSCHHHEMREAEIYLDKACGNDTAGVVWMRKWKKYYGRTGPRTWICPMLNAHESWDYIIKPHPIWVDGKMYEEWKYGGGSD